MKKINVIISTLVLSLVLITTGYTCPTGDCPDTAITIGSGNAAVDTAAIGGGIGVDVKVINNGIAGGFSGAGGVAQGVAAGNIVNGEVGVSADVTAGGLTNTTSYKFTPTVTSGVDLDHAAGVGSRSDSVAVVAGTVTVNVDPAKNGIGSASGAMYGLGGEASLDSSLITTNNKFDSNGISTGIAAQGAVGGFEGNVLAASGPDVKICGHTFDSNADGSITADVRMTGWTQSDSYRYVINNDNVKTEVLGSQVGAGTDVTSSSNVDVDHNGLGIASGCVTGAYEVAGGVVSKTAQVSDSGLGLGVSNAVGSYEGAGTLNTNYTGSNIGGSYTSMTTVNGMNGTIVNSGANMTTISIGARNPS